MTEFRIETDTMGDVCVPACAHYGAQTQRAVANFPISGIRFSRRFIRALGLVKAATAGRSARDIGATKSWNMTTSMCMPTERIRCGASRAT